MMFNPAGAKVHMALRLSHMRKGVDGLAILLQDVLKNEPFARYLFASQC